MVKEDDQGKVPSHALFQTYGCGIVLACDMMQLVESFRNNAEYIQDAAYGDISPNFWNFGLELTRPARAIKL